eukprot:1314584-Amorphochlora_amoeboformis.AAC.1
MVNDTEGGVFYFARLSKGVLRWSDRGADVGYVVIVDYSVLVYGRVSIVFVVADKWRSRNRQAVVFDEKEQTQQKKKKTGFRVEY